MLAGLGILAGRTVHTTAGGVIVHGLIAAAANLVKAVLLGAGVTKSSMHHDLRDRQGAAQGA